MRQPLVTASGEPLYRCPSCGAMLRPPANAKNFAKLQCGKCGKRFVINRCRARGWGSLCMLTGLAMVGGAVLWCPLYFQQQLEGMSLLEHILWYSLNVIGGLFWLRGLIWFGDAQCNFVAPPFPRDARGGGTRRTTSVNAGGHATHHATSYGSEASLGERGDVCVDVVATAPTTHGHGHTPSSAAPWPGGRGIPNNSVAGGVAGGAARGGNGGGQRPGAAPPSGPETPRAALGLGPVYSSSYQGDLGALQEAHRIGFNFNDGAPISGVTCLQYASDRGHIACVRFLLSVGADPNTHSTKGSSPLLQAAASGHLEVIQELVAGGAHEFEGNSKTGLRAPTFAALNGHVHLVDFFLERGHDPNHKPPKQMSALQCAAKKGFDSVVSSLVQGGADINMPTAQGLTPLHLAVQVSLRYEGNRVCTQVWMVLGRGGLTCYGCRIDWFTECRVHPRVAPRYLNAL